MSALPITQKLSSHQIPLLFLVFRAWTAVGHSNNNQIGKEAKAGRVRAAACPLKQPEVYITCWLLSCLLTVRPGTLAPRTKDLPLTQMTGPKQLYQPFHHSPLLQAPTVQRGLAGHPAPVPGKKRGQQGIFKSGQGQEMSQDQVKDEKSLCSLTVEQTPCPIFPVWVHLGRLKALDSKVF